MKDIITSGFLGAVLVFMLLFAAPILNEAEVNEDVVKTEEVINNDDSRKEIKN